MQSIRPFTGDIVYVLGRFPVLSETFVQKEIIELENQGIHVQVFSLFKKINTQGAEAVWDGKAPYTCISQYSILFLLMKAIQCFLRSPLRFIRTYITMLRHYRLRFLIGCRVLLFASFLATKFEHKDIAQMHAHFASESTSVALFTYLLTGVPYSFTAHANDIYLSSKDDLAFRMNMARFIVTISNYNLEYLKNIIDKKNSKSIHCIYNGIELQDFSRSPSFLPERQAFPLILSVCRLVEKKGLMYLLYACRILVDRKYDFVCNIVGDGPQRLELEQKICELNLSKTVILLGAETHKQVMERYQKASIMVLPCIVTNNGDRDGIPTALIESLCAGIPSVSTTVSGIAELITSEINGLLVPPNDSTALADALARLLDNKELCSTLAANGFNTVKERFNIKSNINNLIKLFYEDE